MSEKVRCAVENREPWAGWSIEHAGSWKSQAGVLNAVAEGASLGRTYGAERRKDEKAGYAAAWENVPDRGKSPCKSGKLEARLVYLGKRKEACEAGEEERAGRRVTGDGVGEVTGQFTQGLVGCCKELCAKGEPLSSEQRNNVICTVFEMISLFLCCE